MAAVPPAFLAELGPPLGLGRLLAAERYGNGHINETWRARWLLDGGEVVCIHQRINRQVFRDVPALMANIERVTRHIRGHLAGLPAPERRRRCLEVLTTRDGRSWLETPDGDAWRSYHFVPGGITRDTPDTPQTAFQVARAFGQFQAWLTDLPAPRLHEILPRFHDTPWRLQLLEEAVAADPVRRAAAVAEEIAFARARRALAPVLLEAHRAGRIPERVTHNDTKINNVLLDAATGEALCVVDLETVMPGLGLYDFGDLVRTAAHTVPEDSRDLDGVRIQPVLFQALVQGWLERTAPILTADERRLLVTAGRLITFEIGVRFLTDHLRGDRYFRVHRPGHNLDRARCQFALVRAMEEQAEELEGLAAEACREAGVPV